MGELPALAVKNKMVNSSLAVQIVIHVILRPALQG